MNYEVVWKLMADLIGELRKSGESVPTSLIKDLRSAKTMIEVLRVNRSRTDNQLRIEEYLNNVESYLMSAAKKRFGKECIEEWMGKILEAQSNEQKWETDLPSRVPIGLPRDKHWIRIRDFPLKKIKQLCEEVGLMYRIEEKGNVLVYGEEGRVKKLVKKMTKLRKS